MKESVKAFFEAVGSSVELQEKLDAAYKAYSGDPSDQKALVEVVLLPAAKEAGFAFTAEEFFAYQQEAEKVQEGEITDSELEAVAGGSLCLIKWWGFKSEKEKEYGDACAAYAAVCMFAAE